MARRVKENKEKKKPIASFSINIPVVFTISGSKETFDKFCKVYDNKKGYFFKKNFLDIFNAEKDADILRDKVIAKKIKELKSTILNQSGIEPSEHSKFQNEKMEEYLKNQLKDKKSDTNGKKE